ncbi:MAG: YfhO family protein [Candidatus Coatesbacteria bacterium]|nr:MAG: YfhO family protein [Candidatus Coatesbacteria bacterium]
MVLFFPHLASLFYLPAAKDTLTFSYPAQVELGRALREGYFPLWSTHLNSPLFAEGQGGFAHPLALLLFSVLPPAAASNLFLLIHLYAGLLFTYLFCRELGQSRFASALAAPAFALGGFFLARLGIYTLITNGVWLPGLLWLAACYRRTRAAPYALAGALGGALALLAGQFQLASYAVVAAVLYAVVFIRPRRNALFAILCFGVLPLLLAAIQLLPTFELWRLSERAADVRSGEYSLWPPQYLQLLLPELFGRAAHPAFAPTGVSPVDTYWGRSSFVESACYVGAIPLLLAGVGFLKRRRWFFLLLGLFAALFACGTYLPLYHVYKYLPPFALFRAPSRLLFYVAFALAVAAGDGLDYFRVSRSRLPIVAAVAAAVVAAAVVLTFRFTLPQFKTAVERLAESKAAAVAEKFERPEAVHEYYADRARLVIRKARYAARLRSPATAFQFAVLGAAVVILWAARRNRLLAAAAPALLLLVTVADLYRYGAGLNPVVRASFVNRPPPVAAAIDPSTGGRVFSSGYSLGPDKHLGLGLIHENTHAIWGYDLLVPRASLRPAAAVKVFELLEDLYTTGRDPGGGRFPRPSAPARQLFRTYGFRYFVQLNPWLGAGEVTRSYFPPYFVYEDAGAAPRARAVPEYLLASSDREALTLLQSEDFNPHRYVVLAEQPASFEPTSPPPPEVELTRSTALEATCRAAGPALLVLDELFYPGWRATVDGRPAEIYRANLISRAVVVPAGPHTVEFRFVPVSFYVGLAISVVSWAVVLGAAAVSTFRRRRRRP